MLLIHLNTESKIPLYKQVSNEIINLINEEVLKPGDKLPSSRSFANQLGVNRTTIYKAYEELWSLGYIESRPGSYSYVRKRAEIAGISNEKSDHLIDWKDKITNKSEELFNSMQAQKSVSNKNAVIDFLSLSPDPKLIPYHEYRKCVNQVLIEKGNEILQYGDPLGFKPLRSFISTQLRLHSISVCEDEILITNGAQQAIELLVKLLINPNDVVIVESPTYSSALPLFRYYNAKLIGVPLAKNGLDLDILEKVLQKHNPKFIYSMPNFHNPTGITSTQLHREKLIQFCEKYNVPLVEDGFVEEMKYFGKVVLPVKSMDKHGIVFYVGTFSKVLFPGLRIGWIAANTDIINRLTAIKQVGDITSNMLNQVALHQFCIQGNYNLHLKRVHKIYRRRMQMALKAAREFLVDKNIFYTKPSGGYVFWVEVRRKGMSLDELINRLNKKGVLVSPGNIHFPEPMNNVCFRISIAHTNENEIYEGIKRISDIIKDM